MDLRKCIRGALCSGFILFGLLIIAVILGFALAALGDRSWAQGVMGVGLVAGVSLVIDFVVLVVLVAVAQLKALESAEEEQEEE